MSIYIFVFLGNMFFLNSAKNLFLEIYFVYSQIRIFTKIQLQKYKFAIPAIQAQSQQIKKRIERNYFQYSH